MSERGTKVEIKLKEDAVEFAEEYRLKKIIHKHSDYIGFPIYVGEGKEPVNKQTSLWRTPKQDVTEDQYKDFYRQATLDFEEPLMHIHMITDVPVQLYALLYIPRKAERGSSRSAQGGWAEAVFPQHPDRRIQQGPAARIPALRAGRGGFGRPAAQRLA